MPDTWIPAVVSLIGTVLLLLINRYFTTRDRTLTDSSSVTTASIGDGASIRRELWERVAKLEAELGTERDRSARLSLDVAQLTSSLKEAKADLATAKLEIRSLTVRLDAARGIT